MMSGDEITISGQVKWRNGTGPYDKDGYYFNRSCEGFGSAIPLWGVTPNDLRILADHLEMVRPESKGKSNPNLIERLAEAVVNLYSMIDPDIVAMNLSPRDLKKLEAVEKEASNILEKME